jgi:peroxiredoxin
MPVSPEELRIGTEAIPFTLPGIDGINYSLSTFSDKKVLCIIFMCNHCPYVQAVEDRLNNIAHDYSDRSFAMVGINPNDEKEYPEDSFENMKKRAKERNYAFPYLRDETQEVAKAYDAVCTPDIYLYDEKRILKYRGRIDDDWKDESQVKSRDLRKAIDRLLNDEDINFDIVPSMGCSIKWKK